CWRWSPQAARSARWPDTGSRWRCPRAGAGCRGRRCSSTPPAASPSACSWRWWSRVGARTACCARSSSPASSAVTPPSPRTPSTPTCSCWTGARGRRSATWPAPRRSPWPPCARAWGWGARCTGAARR
ncbi:MAG: Fluoride ion transporter CrcB, partial [uncultured Quadrisphaera sp.]